MICNSPLLNTRLATRRRAGVFFALTLTHTNTVTRGESHYTINTIVTMRHLLVKTLDWHLFVGYKLVIKNKLLDSAVIGGVVVVVVRCISRDWRTGMRTTLFQYIQRNTARHIRSTEHTLRLPCNNLFSFRIHLRKLHSHGFMIILWQFSSLPLYAYVCECIVDVSTHLSVCAFRISGETRTLNWCDFDCDWNFSLLSFLIWFQQRIIIRRLVCAVWRWSVERTCCFGYELNFLSRFLLASAQSFVRSFAVWCSSHLRYVYRPSLGVFNRQRFVWINWLLEPKMT